MMVGAGISIRRILNFEVIEHWTEQDYSSLVIVHMDCFEILPHNIKVLGFLDDDLGRIAEVDRTCEPYIAWSPY
jgi:hypothetical protein